MEQHHFGGIGIQPQLRLKQTQTTQKRLIQNPILSKWNLTNYLRDGVKDPDLEKQKLSAPASHQEDYSFVQDQPIITLGSIKWTALTGLNEYLKKVSMKIKWTLSNGVIPHSYDCCLEVVMELPVFGHIKEEGGIQ